MTLPVRYSPSGSPITNVDGGDLKFGTGARLRLVEACSTMGGSLAVPAVAAVISAAGFTDSNAIVLTLGAPKEKLNYRAKLSLDIINANTNVDAEVVLYLDVSVDDGATYTNAAKSMHKVGAGTDLATDIPEARSCDVYMPLILGTSLGVDDSEPTSTIKLRARASMPLGTAATLLVNSAATSDGGTPVTGLNGTIHMELEECF